MGKQYRINGFKQIRAFFALARSGKHPVRASHIGLYMHLLDEGNSEGWPEWLSVKWERALMSSGIGSNGTFYRVLGDLDTWKLIKYKKGVNKFSNPKIHIKQLCNNEQVTAQVYAQVTVQLPAQVTAHIKYNHITSNLYNLLTKNQEKISKRDFGVDELMLIESKEFKALEKKAKESSEQERYKPDYQDELKYPYEDAEFFEAWEEWREYKKVQFKFTYRSKRSEQGALNKVGKLSDGKLHTAVEVVEQSIDNGYMGLFPIKQQKTEKNGKGFTSKATDWLNQ